MYSLLIFFFLLSLVFSFLCSLWEATLLSISPTYAQLKMSEGSLIGKKLQAFKANIDRPLAAILSLNTIANTMGAIGVGEQATQLWQETNPIITSVVVPLTMTFSILFLSEIIPKTLGATYWKKFVPFTVYSLTILIKLFLPLIWIAKLMTQSFQNKKNKSVFTRADFATLAEIGEQQGVLTESESAMIEKSLDLYELDVTEVMRPAKDIVTVNKTDSIESLTKLVQKHHYSRYPVYDADKKEIIGIVHVKDLVTKSKTESIEHLIRPVIKIPENLLVNELLKRFHEGLPKFALVYNEDDKLTGFITLDTILHVLFGVIQDEFNRTHLDWVINKDGTVLANGYCSLNSLETALDTGIQVDVSLGTIADLIKQKLGRVPEEGECLQFNNFDLKVEKVKGEHVQLVKIFPKEINKKIKAPLDLDPAGMA